MTRASPFDKRYVREQKRSAILAEAAALFNVHGARATRLSDVAARLNLNQSSLYYYVDSKDDLIFQTYLASCACLDRMLERAEREAATGAARIGGFVRAYFEAWQAVARGERPHFAILTEIRGLRPPHRAAVARRYLDLFQRVRGYVEQGARDGSLRPGDSLDLAVAVFGLVQMVVLWLGKIEPADYGKAADAFVDILFNGIAANAGPLDDSAAVATRAGAPSAWPQPPAEKPQAFCAVGSDCFNRKGFRGASLDEIAEQLDVSKGSFYHHVRDKDDLLRQCFRRSLDLIASALSRAGQGSGSGLQKLWACAWQLFAVQNSSAGPLIRFNLIPSLAPRHQEEIRADIADVSERLGDLIREGIGDGSIRPVDVLVAEHMLLTGIDLSADLRQVRPAGDPAAAFRSYFGFYFRGLADPPRPV
jgi:AcrR family transcriptional regulator